MTDFEKIEQTLIAGGKKKDEEYTVFCYDTLGVHPCSRQIPESCTFSMRRRMSGGNGNGYRYHILCTWSG